jgi:acyl-CoA synthetase (AMP-forming)/AMP-acid ligase II
MKPKFQILILIAGILVAGYCILNINPSSLKSEKIQLLSNRFEKTVILRPKLYVGLNAVDVNEESNQLLQQVIVAKNWFLDRMLPDFSYLP